MGLIIFITPFRIADRKPLPLRRRTRRSRLLRLLCRAKKRPRSHPRPKASTPTRHTAKIESANATDGCGREERKRVGKRRSEEEEAAIFAKGRFRPQGPAQVCDYNNVANKQARKRAHVNVRASERSVEALLRARRVPPGAGKGHQVHHGEAGRAGRHVHRGGQIADLPGPRRRARQHHHRGLSPGLAHERPGEEAR